MTRKVRAMEIREYTAFREDEIRRLYASVGWKAYTDNMSALEQGFGHSLLVMAAFEGGKLLGIIRVVGDGHTIVFLQDILVDPDHQRKGIGTALVQAVLDRYPAVRQIQLTADSTPESTAFYRSLGFTELAKIGCSGWMKC